ncbi:hypothetical protein ACFXMT_33760 [Streptomyces mirabilis]|uniref:hypothetical protein n=1 Tax=Streptomyces mirabilis TaxID=68239 RepID=UPI00369EDC7B
MMTIMNAPGDPLHSYAAPARRHSFVHAMRQLADTRQPGPVRVYFSTPPDYPDRPNWQRRFDAVREALPQGVELLHYSADLANKGTYQDAWTDLANTLDGLVVAGQRAKAGKTRLIQLGPTGRRELITIVGAGKPVLLHSMEHGLVPVLDCQPKRTGTEPNYRLRLTIPRDWQGSAPTLQAALAALAPAGTEAETGQRRDALDLFNHPFAAPPR